MWCFCFYRTSGAKVESQLNISQVIQKHSGRLWLISAVEYVYEDLNGRVRCVDLTEDLVTYFQCDDVKEVDATRKLTLTCLSVKESEVQPGFQEL
ncbi:hypothetical protein N480_00795 [Pseudoalteromonas luteoviolacea S2607]|uniref:hypothetical protein n=1 Tax=Pseudoalteromonas luteoviolacea TaxID=43657 RepID=UPI0007B0B0E7|nr:hypothetical protein [Pseudoalteromonas luteoviolacea]KZN39400.1 hypothetical protein N480_00795 [Pseudoalteromonas luteoviolacea S2607]